MGAANMIALFKLTEFCQNKLERLSLFRLFNLVLYLRLLNGSSQHDRPFLILEVFPQLARTFVIFKTFHSSLHPKLLNGTSQHN
jgi:hypothetical protein